jgi:Type I phosphodiesterase / nucleotide pyrophosphatase
MHLPDYHGGSIVNLMRSIELGLGARPCAGAAAYPELRALPAEALAGARNVVLLVIDGLGHDYLARAGAGGALARHLKARITSVFPSTTATAITAFLTGVGPQQHALPGWQVWLRELGGIVLSLRFRPRHGGAVLSKCGFDPRALYTAEPMFDRLPLESHVVSPGDIIDSDYNVAHCGTAARHPYKELPELFEKTAALLDSGGGRKFIHGYIPEIDYTAHAHGSDSPALRSKLNEIDTAFGRFLEAISGSGSVVIATADHGFIDSPKAACIELDDHPQLADTLMLPLTGERRVAYCHVQPGREQAFEDYILSRLAHAITLHRSADLIAQGWFGLGPVNPRLAGRIGQYTLVMKDNYTLKDWIPGEPRHLYLGVHGGVSAAEMYVPLIVARP